MDNKIILKPMNHTVQSVFNLPSQMPIPGFEPGHPWVPEVEPNYVWDTKVAKDYIEWITDPRPDNLYLVGPTGCGKTQGLLNMFGNLHIPTVLVSCRSDAEPMEMLGRTQLRNGDTVFVPGAVIEAYQTDGCAIIFDEGDQLRPETAVSLHRLFERAPLMLDDGTIVKPGNNIKIVVTANTRGDGQDSHQYGGSSIWSLASLGRFEKKEAFYPSAETEEKILQNNYGGKLADEAIKCMVKTANDIRLAFVQGNCPAPFSIRDLLRWGKKLIISGPRTDILPVYHSFDCAFGYGTDPHVRQMLHVLVQSHFGIAPHPIKGV